VGDAGGSCGPLALPVSTLHELIHIRIASAAGFWRIFLQLGVGRRRGLPSRGFGSDACFVFLRGLLFLSGFKLGRLALASSEQCGFVLGLVG
jgi:hypothetical protein